MLLMTQWQPVTVRECDEVCTLLMAFYVVSLQPHISVKYYERRPPLTDEETEAQRLGHLPEVRSTHCD